MENKETIERVVSTLHSLKRPYYFKQDADKVFSRPQQQAKLKSAIEGAERLCDALGFRFAGRGSASLAFVVHAESMSVEEMVGRSILVQDEVKSFKEFDMRNHWAFPFFINIFYIFDTSERSFNFRHTVQDHCKHTKLGVLRTIHVRPWNVDIQGKSVRTILGMLNFGEGEQSEIEAKMFS